MRRMFMLFFAAILFVGCTPPKEELIIQTFSPIMVDMTKIEEKNYQELIDAVNTHYASSTNEFIDARFLSEQGMFLYFHVYSGKDSGCYRVTVDKNRKKIVNMQPDCAVDVD